MPIRGLTHQAISFPEVGQLRKGGPKTDPRKPGPDLTYFRFTTDDTDARERFDAAYSEEPRLINVFLPFRTVDENWTANCEEWSAGGLIHRCDGEYVSRMRMDDGKYYDPEPGTVKCPYASGEKQRTKDTPGCKPSAYLKVVIPELRRMAYVTALTTSQHDISNLDAQLRGIFAETGEKQDLRGIPMQLRRRKYMKSAPELYPKGHPQQYQPTGNRVRREMWLLSIEVQPDWFRLQLASREAMALPESTATLHLPEPEVPLLVDDTTGEMLDSWDDEIEEGVFEEPEPPQKKQSGRPLGASSLQAVIRNKAKWVTKQPNDYATALRNLQGEPISVAQTKAVASLMDKAVKPTHGISSAKERDERRIGILKYLFGEDVESTENLYSLEASAIIDWLKDEAEGSWELNEYAHQEAANVYAARLKEQGQMEMPL